MDAMFTYANDPSLNLTLEERTQLQHRAHSGDAGALVWLAELHLVGRGGFAPDLVLAVQLFQRQVSATQHPAAQMMLAMCLRDGEGCARDTDKSRRLYLASADQGNAYACCHAALNYSSGSHDFEKDMLWALYYLSLIHISEPTRPERSRMPSSA